MVCVRAVVRGLIGGVRKDQCRSPLALGCGVITLITRKHFRTYYCDLRVSVCIKPVFVGTPREEEEEEEKEEYKGTQTTTDPRVPATTLH